MDIQFYETFLEVADTLNFRAASENLKVVQSTVSNRIQALEEFYGQPLFNRSNKKVVLSNAGKVLKPYALRMTMLQKEALIQTKSLTEKKGQLRIGVEPSIYHGDVVELIRLYSKENKEVSLKVQLDSSKILLKKLEDGLIDIAFVYNKSVSSGIDFVPHQRDVLIFAVDQSLIPEDSSTEALLTKESLLGMDIVLIKYSDNFMKWIHRFFPEEFEYAMELDASASPIDHISGLGRTGFILESEFNKHPLKETVASVRIKGVDMPYFQSYIAYRNQNEKRVELMSFMECLSRQK